MITVPRHLDQTVVVDIRFVRLPLAAVILVSRYLDKDVTALDAVIWCGIGGTMTVILYWFFVMPDSLRAKLRRRVGMGASA